MVNGEIGFIVAAYAVAALVIGALVASVLLDYRAQRRMLERLKTRTGLDEEAP